MATTQSSPAAVPLAVPASAASARVATAPAAHSQTAVALPQARNAQALTPVPPSMPAEEQKLLDRLVDLARLPVELDVVVPIVEFRVRSLLALETGKVIQSQWNCGEDVPLSAGKVQLARSEFEVIDGQLAVRITRLV